MHYLLQKPSRDSSGKLGAVNADFYLVPSSDQRKLLGALVKTVLANQLGTNSLISFK